MWLLGAVVRSPLKPLAGALLPGKVQSRLGFGGLFPARGVSHHPSGQPCAPVLRKKSIQRYAIFFFCGSQVDRSWPVLAGNQ